MASLDIGGKNFLFTADEGAEKMYNGGTHGFTWTDRITASSIGKH